MNHNYKCNYLGCGRDWRTIHIPNCSSCVLSANTHTHHFHEKCTVGRNWKYFVVQIISTVVQGTKRKTKIKVAWLQMWNWLMQGRLPSCICQHIPFTSLESLCSICLMVVDTVTVLDSNVEILGYRGTVSYSVIKLHVPQQTSFVYRNCDSKLKMTI